MMRHPILPGGAFFNYLSKIQASFQLVALCVLGLRDYFIDVAQQWGKKMG